MKNVRTGIIALCFVVTLAHIVRYLRLGGVPVA